MSFNLIFYFPPPKKSTWYNYSECKKYLWKPWIVFFHNTHSNQNLKYLCMHKFQFLCTNLYLSVSFLSTDFLKVHSHIFSNLAIKETTIGMIEQSEQRGVRNGLNENVPWGNQKGGEGFPMTGDAEALIFPYFVKVAWCP